jgi:hypothetical protein
MRSSRHTFRNGLALSAGIAVTIDAYVFAKNLSMDALLFYSLPLIALVLMSMAITYFAFSRLNSDVNLPTNFVISIYSILTIECGLLLLSSFIRHHIINGYIFLPIAIDIAGAIILVGITSVLRSKINDSIKMSIFLASFILATAALIFTN